MFTTFLQIDGFRAFDHLRVEGLRRVNIIVGMNNVGKTCLLEAVEWAASERADALLKGLVRRGLERDAPVHARRGRNFPFIDSVFHRAQTPHFAQVEWSGGKKSAHRRSSENSLEPDLLVVLAGDQERLLSVSDGAVTTAGWIDGYDIDEDRGAVFLGIPRTHDLEIDSLWESIALTWAEEHVLSAVKLLVPSADRIAVLGSDAFVKTPSGRHRLAEYGEGTTRIAAVIMAVAAAKRVALLDEIDTGLHHSVLSQMLEMVVTTSKSADNQVFATTHSEDCLRAVARLAAERPEVAAEIAVHRLEPGRVVTLSADEVATALQHDIEVRGIA